MANFIDYLDWRGDLSFQEAPFNEVDALLLSYLSYVNFDEVLPGVDRKGAASGISLSKAREQFFTIHRLDDFKKDRSFIRLAPYLLDCMGATRRFGSILLSNYVNHIDIREEVQFSAVRMDLGNARLRETPQESFDNLIYISFRGTDDTIIGWKEDFNISYLTVPAEQESIDYVNTILKDNTDPVIMGGHSKGAHLAIYAAARSNENIRHSVRLAYNFDGPGFHRDFLESAEMREISGRVRRFVPEDSVIGMLLDHNIPPVIVQSNGKGILQHDPFTWQLMGTAFVTCGKLGKLGTLMDKTFTEWIAQVEPSQRKVFIDDLFSVLEASGAQTLTELYSGNAKSYLAMVKRLDKLDDRTGQILKLLMESMFDHLTEQMKPTKRTARRLSAESLPASK
ncbi:MAG: DUF2974 domain-containing protein [Lachnospiraceae bacterium]|nr:DUF2974 domain-containing protein [Lachnospiraceae bacterium]